MPSVDNRSVFQLALLASELATEDQLKDAIAAARDEFEPLNADGGNLPPKNHGKPHGAAFDKSIAAVLVRRGLLTEYQTTQLLAGRSKLNLGPYIITDWIGQGGMSQVFKGIHKVMGRVCAVKVLPLEKATEEARVSFIREIRLLAGLDCPYLVRAFDAGQDGNVHYLVTEYVPGQDLRKLIKSQKRLSQQQSASLIRQAALGLAYAHRSGLIHRDVKPGNILVTPSGVVKVSDVGLAAWSTSILEDPRAGKIVGTADYLSPEQIRTPLEVTPVSDIYSLGCSLYFCVCGKVPYPGGDGASKCRRHCEETPWHPRKFAPEISEDFVDIIADMMDKDPQRRIATADDVADRLDPFCSESSDWLPQLIAQGPWSAPPPPNDEAQIHLSSEQTYPTEPAAIQHSPNHLSTGIQSGGSGEIPPPPTSHLPLVQPPSNSAMLPVGIALAIAIPLALLVGAVIGFLVRGSV